MVNDSIFIHDVSDRTNKIKINKKIKALDAIIIETPMVGVKDFEVEIRTSHQKKTKTTKNNFTISDEFFYNPLAQSNNINNSFIKTTKDGFLIKTGEYIIKETIKLTGNLTIEEGVKLLFAEETALIVNGNLNLKGTKDNQIYLKGINNNLWKGIYVYEGKGNSIINFSNFENIRDLDLGLINLTGALNFYKSDIIIKNSKIKNIQGEDALNIIESQFVIDNFKIDKTTSDGFDSDFSNGVIKNSEFTNILGDATDFSGSEVEMNNIIFNYIGDKSVSAGENSVIEIDKIHSINSTIGVASKDGSRVDINNSKFTNIKNYSLMTFYKKVLSKTFNQC